MTSSVLDMSSILICHRDVDAEGMFGRCWGCRARRLICLLDPLGLLDNPFQQRLESIVDYRETGCREYWRTCA